MHNLQAERCYKPRMMSGIMASADGPIKTFPLRGVKDSPPYLHDGRLLTLEDTVEFFNLIFETQLGPSSGCAGITPPSLIYEVFTTALELFRVKSGLPGRSTIDVCGADELQRIDFYIGAFVRENKNGFI